METPQWPSSAKNMASSGRLWRAGTLPLEEILNTKSGKLSRKLLATFQMVWIELGLKERVRDDLELTLELMLPFQTVWIELGLKEPPRVLWA